MPDRISALLPILLKLLPGLLPTEFDPAKVDEQESTQPDTQEMLSDSSRSDSSAPGSSVTDSFVAGSSDEESAMEASAPSGEPEKK